MRTLKSSITVSQWLDKLMKVYQEGTISPNFYARRKDLIRIHIEPAIGSIQLLKLKPADIKKFYNDLEKSGRKAAKKKNGKTIPLKEGAPKGLATGTIRHIHNILNPAMKQAVREGLVPRNVVADVTPPRIVRTREAKPLNKDQVGKYLGILKENRLYAAFLLDLITGLRRGELIGLQWKDLNMETRELKIRRQITRLQKEDGKSSLEYAPLKTPASYRAIILPTIAINELKAHRKRQAAEELLAGGKYDKKEGLIFCTPLGKKLDTRCLYRIHSKALEDAGLQHTAFHDLRHSCATLLLQAGENIKTIQNLLGHSDIETTLNCYSHVLDEMKQSAADKLESIFADVLTPKQVPSESDSVTDNTN